MTSLEVLQYASRSYKGWWHALESFTAANCVIKWRLCQDWTYNVPKLTPLQSFTALQHLVLIRGAVCMEKAYFWEELGSLTWVSQLELRGVVIGGVNDAYVSLPKTLGAMSQLVSLRMSIGVSVSTDRYWRDATQVLAEMNSLSSLVCLKELSIVCMCRSEGLQSCSHALPSCKPLCKHILKMHKFK